MSYFTLDTVFADQDGDGDNELTGASLGEDRSLEVWITADTAAGIESFDLKSFDLEWVDTGTAFWAYGTYEFEMSGVSADGRVFVAE